MRDVLSTTARILTFRATRDELLSLDRRHLVFGFLCTWLVGMGRYWDHDRAHLLQHLGLGSLIYVVLLSLFLFLLMRPLDPADWSYRRVLTFVTLLSPPAALYAIPVERFVSLEAARSMNAWFLAVVAAWRVALLFFFLRRLARFSVPRVVVAGLLPLTVIVSALVVLNLEHATFQIMGGIRDASPHDAAYEVLLILTGFSMLAVLPLSLGYLALIVMTQRRRLQERAPEIR